MTAGLEAATTSIRALAHADEERLAQLFAENDQPAITGTFTPFPLNADSARRIARNSGRDRYYVAEQVDRLVGFCMLRGWDEGYEVPSFGVFVDHACQGMGIGRALTEFAICESARLGCGKLRLTVYESNTRAIDLYSALGFRGSSREPVVRGGHTDVKLTMIRELRDAR